jgi:hypothetical protein
MPKQVYDQYQSELRQGRPSSFFDSIRSYFGTLPVWEDTLPGTPEDATYLLSELRKDVTPVEGTIRSGIRSAQEAEKAKTLLEKGDYTGAIEPGIWSLLESADVGLSTMLGPHVGGALSVPIDLARTIRKGSKLSSTPPKSSSPVVPVAEVPKYIDDIPDLTPADLKDLKVFPIHADLTDGGTVYTGIDSSKLDQGVGLYGGKKFPNLESSRDANVVWAVQGGQGKILRNLDEADHAVVVSMGHEAHRGNTTFADSTLNTMDAYVRDGRIGKRNLKRLDKLVRQTTPKMKNSVKQALENFPGFGAPGYQKYLENLSFDARARIVQQLASSQGQILGAPNITKISRKLEDPSTYGTNLGDAMILIKLDKGPDNLVELGVHPGTTKHPSYKYGVKGEVVGKFPAPTSYESVFSDFSKSKREGGAKIHNILRASDLGPPVETLTKEKIKNIQFTPLQHIQSPKQAQLALEAAKGNWRTTLMPVGRGGASPTDFINAIRNSDASATLTEYNLKELQQGIKSGSFNVFQLGGKDTQVFFGIKRTNYADEYGFNHPDLGPNEKAVVGVVNNEPGAKGVAAPGVMGKAIEEGATALDAYAVPSQKYPRGFLPKVYNDYGFVELGRVPFDEKYVRSPKFGGSETKYQDLLEYWRSTGWDESLGMPELVIMKWKGDNAIRSNAVRHINENGSLNPGGQVAGLSEAAEKYSGQPTGSVNAGPPGTGSINNPGRTGGGIRDSNATYSGDRFRNVLSELHTLNPSQLQNLGLTPQSLLY